MIGKLQNLHQLWRHFGPEWLAYRLTYATRIRMGLLSRSMPARTWADQPLKSFLSDAALAEPESYLHYRHNSAPDFFFASSRRRDYQSLLAGWDEGVTTPVALGEELARGRMRYFEHTFAQTGFPPDWHANPFTGERAPADLHWSQIGDFGSGDIKIIWEPNRFGFAYTLVRAYWRTGDDRYAEIFWQLVEDWQARNPPQQGPNWKCGQEISFRVMAWVFALYGFMDSKSSSAGRVAGLAQMIAVSGQRIESNLDYALSQRNNHGISEGVGLSTIGSLFPELRDAGKWKQAGRRVLEEQGRELIYDDGAFSQHSVNYSRVMLHDYLWALRLGDLHVLPFSDELRERVNKAGDFLYQIQDDRSGRVPYYGQNDGALILPLNNCDYQDFRPVIGAARYLTTSTRSYDGGPWDEDLLWLFGPEALAAEAAPAKREDFKAATGGYYTLRSVDGFIFTRAASFRHRPGQADMLHTDLWWRGQNIAPDAGTYSYNAPAPWNNPLAHTAYHNTVTVDGHDQMRRAGKFLWLPWLAGRLSYEARSEAGHLSYLEGEHDGYHRLPDPATHRRAIVRLGEYAWLVLDSLDSLAPHLYRLHWLVADLPSEWDDQAARLTLSTPAGLYCLQLGVLEGSGDYSLVRADPRSPRGWRAPYYYYREPALSMELKAKAASLRFWSLWAGEPCRVSAIRSSFEIEANEWKAAINLGIKEKQSLASELSVTGAVKDYLKIS